ncbi:hypothetical protein PPL_12074 [Heterostelium album PN500]|uniref:Uncharacterized protein n=1 Tax=Heterostelium pallidum (strain ATCC 26659 / Pp 5 / PN500) TaxID=670386 RepID=D3BLM1_HETP5|nr:hypothetical protein PPL_12074 [Heterostelium album PN500]EFA77472.1 hypothetical protein PPL_12074 [Heterostelium album PN500]|eukprot:XP_020429600.1 hypothetical protein PPL_12074 [Heterostelium album PN500]
MTSLFKSSQFLLSQTATAQMRKNLLNPIMMVVHGNNFLDSLKTNNNTDSSKQILESIRITMQDEAKKKSEINAKEWLQNLHKKNGTEHLSLSRCNSPFSAKKQAPAPVSNPELVLVSSELNDKSHQSWKFTNDAGPEGKICLTANPRAPVNDYLLWKKIALGDVRERFKEALERMRDFTILNIHQMDLIPKSSQMTFLNNLAEAENFIHMDVMLSTKKDLDRLYDFLNLPRDYGLNPSQVRVALQILNATALAWIDMPISRPSSSNQALNTEYIKLSKELYESLLDSMICSANYIE